VRVVTLQDGNRHALIVFHALVCYAKDLCQMDTPAPTLEQPLKTTIQGRSPDPKPGSTLTRKARSTALSRTRQSRQEELVSFAFPFSDFRLF
jgi:hypothetical protein